MRKAIVLALILVLAAVGAGKLVDEHARAANVKAEAATVAYCPVGNHWAPCRNIKGLTLSI